MGRSVRAGTDGLICRTTEVSRYVDNLALNIRNREAEKLATDLVALTGESKTEAVKRALQDRLERLTHRNRQGKHLWTSCSRLLAAQPRI